MRSWHCNNESEYVINERVKRLIHECSPRERRYRPQSVVNKQLWQHEEESKRIDTIDDAVKKPRVPAGNIKIRLITVPT